MQKYALIVAGGKGKRMAAEIPKQFLELEGKPVLMHAINRFYKFDPSIKIVIVLPENLLDYWSDLQKKHSFKVPHRVVKGGEHRFFSVKSGLKAIENDCLVAIHDGVRPLVSVATINRCFEAAGKFGNAIPVISLADSLRVIDGDNNMPAIREKYRLIQTPQVFESGLIRNAYRIKYSPDFTDDATVLERTGIKIHLVEGNRENIKITNPEDLAVAASLFMFVT